MTLDEEGQRATELLTGKVVKSVKRHRPQEIMIEFKDGARLFVDATTEPVELSIEDSGAE